MKNLELTGVFPDVARAYEIALLGGFSITITYSHDLWEYPQAPEDYQEIKKYFKWISFVSDGDIWVEIVNPANYKRGENTETLDSIYNRVGKASENIYPKNYNGEACEELIKKAQQKLSLSLTDVKLIYKIAQTAARLDNSDVIKAHHVAEGIQYRIKEGYNNKVIIAEGNMIKFGKNIIIKKGDLEEEDVKAAIEYLNTCL